MLRLTDLDFAVSVKPTLAGCEPLPGVALAPGSTWAEASVCDEDTYEQQLGSSQQLDSELFGADAQGTEKTPHWNANKYGAHNRHVL